MVKVEALVVTKNEGIRDKTEHLLSEQGIAVETHDAWAQTLIEQNNYAYYLLDDDILDTVESLQIPPTSLLIGLSRERSFDRVRQWMQAGAHDLIVVPDELETLSQFIQKTMPQLQRGKESEAQKENLNSGLLGSDDALGGGGRVSAFYSAKGGGGKTLISAMSAQSLQLQFGKRVILIDFNAQFGGVEVVFGLEPTRSYLDLLPVLQELSFNHIQNVSVVEETTGVTVLFSPASPEQSEQITDELVTRLIRTCRAHFDHVILDLPSTLNTISFTGLNEAHQIYYVITPDSLSVRCLKQAIALFKRFQIGNQGNLHLIVNRMNKKSELTEKDVENLVDLPAAGVVRADYFTIQPLLNMGRPFYTKKSDKGASKVAQDVRLFVEKAMLGRV